MNPLSKRPAPFIRAVNVKRAGSVPACPPTVGPLRLPPPAMISMRPSNPVQTPGGHSVPPEYLAAHATPELFVRGFYQDVLGQVPSSTAEQLWVNALSVGTTQAVAASMLQSNDALAVIVETGFANTLHRWPTSTELQFWTNQLQTGQITAGELMMRLLAGNEFYNLTYAVIR